MDRLKVCWLAAATAAMWSAAASVATAQTAGAGGCAVQPEGEAPNVRALPATCGSARFPVDAKQRRQGALQVRIGDSSLYVRTIRSTYADGSGATSTQTAVQPLHRLMQPGEATDPIATARNGLVLISVSLDVDPPGYGSAPPRLALTGLQDATIPGAEAGRTADLDPAEWVLIGSVSAHLDQLRDTVAIGRQKGRFDRLVISAHGNDLPVQSVLVVPVGAPAYAIELRTVLAPGAISSIIPIDPPDFLREVIVTYGTAALAGRATAVEVRGRFAENWLGRTGENRQNTGGWVLLGTVDVIASPHSGLSRGAFRVSGQEGAVFKRLRFIARRGAVDLAGVTIDTGGGQEESVAVERVLLPDIESPAVAFPSGPLAIASVTVRPRIRTHARMDSAVEIWAQY